MAGSAGRQCAVGDTCTINAVAVHKWTVTHTLCNMTDVATIGQASVQSRSPPSLDPRCICHTFHVYGTPALKCLQSLWLDFPPLAKCCRLWTPESTDTGIQRILQSQLLVAPSAATQATTCLQTLLRLRYVPAASSAHRRSDYTAAQWSSSVRPGQLASRSAAQSYCAGKFSWTVRWPFRKRCRARRRQDLRHRGLWVHSW